MDNGTVAPRVMGIEEARTKLGGLVAEMAEDGRPVFLQRWGTTRAVLVPVGDYMRLRQALKAVAAGEVEHQAIRARQVLVRAGLATRTIDRILAAQREINDLETGGLAIPVAGMVAT